MANRIAYIIGFVVWVALISSPSALAQNPTLNQEYFLARMDPPYVLPDGVRVKADVVFDSPGGRDIHLDIFTPESGKGPFPAILFIQGSGYNGNNKSCFWREASFFATRGFIGVCIEHRGLNPDGATWPAMLADARAGLEWMKDEGTHYGVDPERIGVLGGSSGGHLAAMLGVAPEKGDATHASVRGVVTINALLDPVYFADHRVWSEEYQFELDLAPLIGVSYPDSSELWNLASPLTYVSGDDPPFLIIHGSEDGTMPIEQIMTMQAALIRAGVPVELVIVEGGKHDMLNSTIYHEVLRMTEKFFTITLKEGEG